MKYRFGAFLLDVDEFRLTRGADLIQLPPKPFDLLAVLVARAGQLITREELLRLVWKDVVVEQSSLNAAISVLRQAVGEEGAALIETVPGRGYRFTAPVQPLAREVAAAQALVTPAVEGARPLRVVVIDDHAVVRLGVRTLLNRNPLFEVVGEAATAAAATDAIASLRPDLAILDLMMGDQSSLPHIAGWCELAPGLRVVVLSMHEEDQWARRVLAAGARGYVMKAEMLDELQQALDAVMAGGVWVSARISRSIVQDFLAGRPLSQ